MCVAHFTRPTYMYHVLVFSSLLIGVPQMARLSLAAQVDNPPQDVTVSRGQTATMMCSVNGDVSVDPFKWQQFQTDPEGSDIYRNPPGSIVATNQNKYQVEGQYNLQISNVELQDGGLYACGVFSQNSPNKANLVVLDQPSMSVGSIDEGDKVPLTCIVEYGAPSELNFGQMPEMHMRIGDNFPINGKTERIAPHPGSGGYLQLRMTTLYTAQGAHNDQELVCSVSTSMPQYAEMTKIILDVRLPTSDTSTTTTTTTPTTSTPRLTTKASLTLSTLGAVLGSVIAVLAITLISVTVGFVFYCRRRNGNKKPEVTSQVDVAPQHADVAEPTATRGPQTSSVQMTGPSNSGEVGPYESISDYENTGENEYARIS